MAQRTGQTPGDLPFPENSPCCDSAVLPWGRYDFFIVSQTVKNGCVTPTHYNVVYDTSQLKPDHVQRLTYKLCHMYYNWSVSVPAGAGTACRRAGQVAWKHLRLQKACKDALAPRAFWGVHGLCYLISLKITAACILPSIHLLWVLFPNSVSEAKWKAFVTCRSIHSCMWRWSCVAAVASRPLLHGQLSTASWCPRCASAVSL